MGAISKIVKAVTKTTPTKKQTETVVQAAKGARTRKLDNYDKL